MEVQNRELYLQHMNDEYRRKHYPEGSGFMAHKKAQKGVNAGLNLFIYRRFPGRQRGRACMVHKQGAGIHPG